MCLILSRRAQPKSDFVTKNRIGYKLFVKQLKGFRGYYGYGRYPALRPGMILYAGSIGSFRKMLKHTSTGSTVQFGATGMRYLGAAVVHGYTELDHVRHHTNSSDIHVWKCEFIDGVRGGFSSARDSVGAPVVRLISRVYPNARKSPKAKR
jgi:hypothetical protein